MGVRTAEERPLGTWAAPPEGTLVISGDPPPTISLACPKVQAATIEASRSTIPSAARTADVEL